MAKDSPRTPAGELKKIVEFRGQKTFVKNCQTAPTVHHHMLLGRVSRKIILAHPKQTPAYSLIRHDWNLKWNWLLWSAENKI